MTLQSPSQVKMYDTKQRWRLVLFSPKYSAQMMAMSATSDLACGIKKKRRKKKKKIRRNKKKTAIKSIKSKPITETCPGVQT